MVPTPQTIKAMRLALGLSQTKAAEVIHSPMRSWQNWEAGTPMHPAFWELFLMKTKKARAALGNASTEGEK